MSHIINSDSCTRSFEYLVVGIPDTCVDQLMLLRLMSVRPEMIGFLSHSNTDSETRSYALRAISATLHGRSSSHSCVRTKHLPSAQSSESYLGLTKLRRIDILLGAKLCRFFCAGQLVRVRGIDFHDGELKIVGIARQSRSGIKALESCPSRVRMQLVSRRLAAGV